MTTIRNQPSDPVNLGEVRLTDVQSTHSKVLEYIFAFSRTFDVHSDFEITPLCESCCISA